MSGRELLSPFVLGLEPDLHYPFVEVTEANTLVLLKYDSLTL